MIFKSYAQDSNAFTGTTSNHTLNIGTNNTAAITLDNSQNATFAGTIKTDLIQKSSDGQSASSFLDFDMDSGGSAGTNNVVLGGVNNVDFLVDTNNNGTTGAFVFGKDANTMSSATQLMTLDESGHLDLKTGNYKVNGTTVIDTSRNLTNIGTISSGAITSSGTEFILGSSSVISRIRTINASGFTETAFDNFSSGAYQERMRISSSGSVGIAKTNPSSSYKLDVNGKIRSQQEILINTGSLFINEEGEGIHILSANGTEYKLTVSNAGALVITEV